MSKSLSDTAYSQVMIGKVQEAQLARLVTAANAVANTPASSSNATQASATQALPPATQAPPPATQADIPKITASRLAPPAAVPKSLLFERRSAERIDDLASEFQAGMQTLHEELRTAKPMTIPMKIPRILAPFNCGRPQQQVPAAPQQVPTPQQPLTAPPSHLLNHQPPRQPPPPPPPPVRRAKQKPKFAQPLPPGQIDASQIEAATKTPQPPKSKPPPYLLDDAKADDANDTPVPVLLPTQKKRARTTPTPPAEEELNDDSDISI